MNDSQPTDILRLAPKEKVRIRIAESADEIRSYQFDPQFGTHAHYRSLYTRRESLEAQVDAPGARVVLALVDDTHIIGFGVLAGPDSDDRWTRLGPGLMLEVKVIETCRDWRSSGIARSILVEMLSGPEIERAIVYMVGYSWTWDLDGTGRTAQQYRMILINLFGPLGFKEFQTNEPNICLKPENLFMARVGGDVSAEVRTNFKWLLYDQYP